MNANIAKIPLWNSNYIKVWIANFFMFFSFYLLLPLLPVYMVDEFDASKQIIGIALSGYTITALLVRPFSGYLVDSFPRKQILLLFYFSFFVFFAGYLIAGTLLLFTIVRTLHGIPFGGATVANSTMAIDVLHPQRRAEGIGYYGLSNNLAMAIGPTVAVFVYESTHNFNILFCLSLAISALGFIINSTLKVAPRELVENKKTLSLDRFFLMKSWSEGITIACVAGSYGILSTYLAIYCQQKFGSTEDTGTFFLILACGLMLSRLIGGKQLRQGKIAENAAHGLLLSLTGYILFVTVPNHIGFFGTAIIIGLGNGHICPALQNMFINLAPHNLRGTANSSFLVSWDIGQGTGMMAGGFVAEYYGYTEAFWLAFAINLAGALSFFLITRSNYLRNKLR